MVKRPAACSLLLSTRDGFCERGGADSSLKCSRGTKSSSWQRSRDWRSVRLPNPTPSRSSGTCSPGMARQPSRRSLAIRSDSCSGRSAPTASAYRRSRRVLSAAPLGIGTRQAWTYALQIVGAPLQGVYRGLRQCCRNAEEEGAKAGNKKEDQVVHVLPAWDIESQLARYHAPARCAGAPEPRPAGNVSLAALGSAGVPLQTPDEKASRH